MAHRSENVLVSTREDRRRSVLAEATVFSPWGVVAGYLAFFAIGLLVVAGCGHQADMTPMERAAAEFDMSRWDAAIAACNDAIAKDPEDAAAYLLRGRAQHLAGRLDRAVDDLTVAIRLNPRDPEAYYQRANAYRALGQIDRKDEDNLTARQLDPNYNYLFKADEPLALDPALIMGDPEPESENSESDSKKKIAGKNKNSDDGEIDLNTPPATDTQPMRSFVEEMFGLPPALSEQNRLGTSRSREKDTTVRGWTPPEEAAALEAPTRRLSGVDRGVGAEASKAARTLDRADRNGRLPAAREGFAGGRDLPAADERGGQPTASRQPGSSAERNLHPFSSSGMRPTGLRDPTAFVDPRTGLPAAKGRAATVGSPYVPPSPYAPVGQLPATGARSTTPSRPLFPPPPGNRYDGGRGYGF